MAKYYTSDTHYNHQRIQEFEPSRLLLGPDIPSMNEALIRIYNEVVRPDDEVYFIGDVAMGNRDLAPAIVRRLMGHKHLILGNHDYKKPGKIYPQLLEPGLFESVQDSLVIQDGDKTLFLCHIPQFEGWHAHYHLAGHVHSSWDRAAIVQTPAQGAGHFRADPTGVVVNVGVDATPGFCPMTLEQLLARPHVVGRPHRENG